ncbi:CRISPR-associated endoribonuclease Cas6 [Desulfotomaculum copahuensis]|uniref:CRISPR-associated endoribonuclease Cas6 n=1 Tax=Desulfotomaculum copahuensis TaxID=1838280 RepID=A0A1B7LCL4_9FIRM|nr:CRISPR-associated endoribonuclease Cas6 [Desulfotomaculum copahuensis]OAT80410.1 CRISPR-associated endoribonuclease Cas6 [Desulfotomaculum copahuensis]
MLISCVIKLSTNAELLVPPSMGQVLHAFFLDRVRNLSPELAAGLHGPAAVKPFTVSPLWGRVEFTDNRWRLFPGEEYAFRVTSISPRLSTWMRDHWLASLSAEIELAGARLQVAGVTVDPQAHPWASSSDYREIYNTWISRDDVPYQFSLEFHSPTAFKNRGINYPLPDPQHVFMHLLQKWNLYSPINLGDNLLAYIEDNVFLRSFKLQTKIIHFDRYKQVGFTGVCSFGIRRREEEIMARVIHMLADFAFYAGVGYKTTMGMGQVRVGR